MIILPDTTAFTAMMGGQDHVTQWIRRSERVVMSAVVIGELLFGYRNGTSFDTNVRYLDRFLDNPFVQFVGVGRHTCDRFGMIAATLRRNGRSVPSNDIWIAAHALETGADLVTFDEHFNHIEGVRVIHLSGH